MSEWAQIELGEVARLSWGDTSTTKGSYTSSGWVAYSASGPDGFLPYFDHEVEAVVINERPFRLLPRYKAAEARARLAGRGVWGTCGGDFHSSR